MEYDDVELRTRFESSDLTPETWTHRAHVRVAWILLTRAPFDQAVASMRAGLRALLPRFGIEDALDRGYHDTVTVAWMRLVADAIHRFGATADSRAFLEAQPHFGQRTLLRLFYSRERLLTWGAKREFAEPDVAPLPPLPAPALPPGPVKRATPADLEAIFGLAPALDGVGAGPERFRRALAAGTVLLADDGDGVAGVLVLDHGFFGRAFVWALEVRADRRRRGLGAALVAAASALRESPDLFVSTNASNHAMQALLEGLGFHPCGEVDHLDPGDPERFYVLES